MALVILLQGIFLLQPTSVPADKKPGLTLHQIVQLFGLTVALVGFAFIFVNKNMHNAQHITSWHAGLGITVGSFPLLWDVHNS